MNSLDLSGQNWNAVMANNLAKFTTKKEAAAFAKQHGWRSSDCIKGDNRFCTWWMVGQMQSTNTFTFLTQSGGFAELPPFGFW